MTAQHCTATEFGRVHVGAEGIRCSTECHVDVQLSAALSVETRERGRSTMPHATHAPGSGSANGSPTMVLGLVLCHLSAAFSALTSRFYCDVHETRVRMAHGRLFGSCNGDREHCRCSTVVSVSCARCG